MSRLDWRSPGAYEDLRSLDAPGFAWEYLRRNPRFVRSRAKLERAAAQGKLLQSTADEFARRWGVRFRREHGGSDTLGDPMDDGGVAKRDRPDGHPAGPRNL
jgi:hypothetical protein